jgi:uncharacterized glyoxalase superfamily metalloenzyme YdcJ
MNTPFADKIEMQHRLFSELSNMFGKEVPLYDKSLLVNKECNKTVCALLSQMYSGFNLSEAQLDKTSGERHGAIRIGKAEEYRWVAGFFAAFGMEPHNFYDMTNLGGKSQPIIATAFRSSKNPEHRVFTSLLMTDYFDPKTRERIEALLAPREVFSERAKELVLKNEKQGGLSEEDGEALIREGINRIFKWTGKARDHQLYKELSDAGFKIAADIACFESHHLNHLTPNTFWIDLYTTAMKFCLGEMDANAHQKHSQQALDSLAQNADKDYLRLQFKHLQRDEIDSFEKKEIGADTTEKLAEKLTQRLQEPDLALNKLKHAGFKDFTEGPPTGVPLLLRQDSYKALTEPVTFVEADGSKVETVHTARFGEIEQRFYAATPKGRKLYDECLAAGDEQKNALLKTDPEAAREVFAKCFAAFPKTLPELLERKLVYGRYSATKKGLAARGKIETTDIWELVKLGYVDYDGLRYEDFLPFSAAGIFASNLGQYGTKSTATEKQTYSSATLEKIMGRKIVDSTELYRQMEEDSINEVFAQLGLTGKNSASEKSTRKEPVAA